MFTIKLHVLVDGVIRERMIYTPDWEGNEGFIRINNKVRKVVKSDNPRMQGFQYRIADDDDVAEYDERLDAHKVFKSLSVK